MQELPIIDSGFWTDKTGLKFSCPHLEKLSGTVSAMEEYNLTAELVSDYPGGSDIQRQLMAAVEHAKQLGLPQVVRVSETSYSVCGIPDTTAEIGFVHQC